MTDARKPTSFLLIAAGFLSLLVLLAGPSPSVAEDLVRGSWQGALRFRGADLAIRLNVDSVGSSLRATLDIPSLLMAWEPISATLEQEGLELELPFGLGPIVVDLTAESPRAEKSIGDHTLELSLQRTEGHQCKRRDVQFKSGETSLAGVLVLPRGDGPHPAVVLLHGSGRQGKATWEYRSWADLLCRQGLAALYYDKRGVGDSGGEFGSGLRQLASDGRAAVEYLRSRSEVDAARIGLHGWSQGAWLAQQIAADLGDIEFLVLVSAAAGTPRSQELQKIEYGMCSDGRTEDEIESALAYSGLYFYVVRTGEGWSLLEQAIAHAQASEWGQYVDQPTALEDLAWWQENHAFQPVRSMNELEIPTLLLYGGEDWITPPAENAAKLQGLFAHPQLVEVLVFPDSDHRLEVGSGQDAEGKWHWPGIAPGATESVVNWLQRQGLIGGG